MQSVTVRSKALQTSDELQARAAALRQQREILSERRALLESAWRAPGRPLRSPAWL